MKKKQEFHQAPQGRILVTNIRRIFKCRGGHQEDKADQSHFHRVFIDIRGHWDDKAGHAGSGSYQYGVVGLVEQSRVE